MTNIVVAVSSLSVRGYWLETSEQGIGYLELSRREGGLFLIWYNYKQGILCKRHIDQLLEATDNPTSCPDRIPWDEDSEPVPDHEPSTLVPLPAPDLESPLSSFAAEHSAATEHEHNLSPVPSDEPTTDAANSETLSSMDNSLTTSML